MDIMFVFGERLTELMFYRDNMSSKALAEMMGVSIRTIDRWKSGKVLIGYTNLIKLADILDCSLEFLFGRTDTQLDFMLSDTLPFYNRLREVMAEKKITWYKLVTTTSIKSAHMHIWKNGAQPKVPALIELSKALGCTLDYLTGRER